MVKFNDAHKAEKNMNFFEEGIHKVKIDEVVFDTDSQDREFVDVKVKGAEGQEATARMWFTTDNAINYTFNILRSIFVHNSPEGAKDKMRQTFDGFEDSDALAEACTRLKGKECWLRVIKSGTYEKDGEIRDSYNRNVYGYEPSMPKTDSVPASFTTPAETPKSDAGEQTMADF